MESGERLSINALLENEEMCQAKFKFSDFRLSTRERTCYHSPSAKNHETTIDAQRLRRSAEAAADRELETSDCAGMSPRSRSNHLMCEPKRYDTKYPKRATPQVTTPKIRIKVILALKYTPLETETGA